MGITMQWIGDKLVGWRHILPGKFCPTFGGNILSQESGHFVTKCLWEENFCPAFRRHNSVIIWPHVHHVISYLWLILAIS